MIGRFSSTPESTNSGGNLRLGSLMGMNMNMGLGTIKKNIGVVGGAVGGN